MTIIKDIKDNFNEFKDGAREALDSIDYPKMIKNTVEIVKLTAIIGVVKTIEITIKGIIKIENIIKK